MAADNEPTPISGHGGVIFDASGGQQPSNGGQPIDETPEPEATASPPTVTLREEIYDFAAIISELAKHPKQGGYGINPAVGIQIIATVLQNNIQLKQVGMMGGMPMMPDVTSDGDTDG